MRYLRYPPRFKAGAGLMARSARVDFLRRQRREAGRRLRVPERSEVEDVVEARLTLQEMAKKRPKALRFILDYIERSHERGTGADRRMAHFYRQQLRAV